MTDPQKPKRRFADQLREIIKLFATGEVFVLVALLVFAAVIAGIYLL